MCSHPATRGALYYHNANSQSLNYHIYITITPVWFQLPTPKP